MSTMNTLNSQQPVTHPADNTSSRQVSAPVGMAAKTARRGIADDQPCLLSQVMVPRATSTREIAALETAMQGLAPDARHPVALELAATATSRQFLLRATTMTAQQHLVDQIQARYPQATIQPVAAEDDPLVVRTGEVVSVVELRAGAAAYLPLRNWRERELLQEGADPLLGVLAVFNHLPAQLRVVTQLALLPASPTWSQAYRRKSVEHPLEPERLRTRREMSSTQVTGPGALHLIGLGVLVALLLVWWRFQHQITARMPSWLLHAGLAVLHGKTPQVTSAELATLIVTGIGVLVGLFCLAYVVLQMRSRFGTAAIYDMRLVGEKTARPAYRVRLRLFVFAPQPEHHPCHAVPPVVVPEHGAEQTAQDAHVRVSVRESYRLWRANRDANHHARRERDEVLQHLSAAYRQYHTASGGYFVPRPLSARNVRHLLACRQSHWCFARRRGLAYALHRSAHLLSVADVAALWHLPQAHDLADLPYVERGRARTLLAPAVVTQGNGWRIGTSSHAGHCVPIFLPDECLRHNLLTIASTGKGKSTLFQHLVGAILAARALSDAGNTAQSAGTTGAGRRAGHAPGYALAFIEPHGDVIQALLGRMPAHERDNVVLVDLANADYPVGLNPLDMAGRDRDKAVDNLITLAEHLWESSYGSRTENVLEYALKTLADVNELLVERDPQQGPDQQYTLLDVVPLLRQHSFRHALFEQVRDEMLLDWWQHYYEPMDAHQQREVTSSVITKLSKFASSRRARRILGQPRSTLDLNAIIRTGQMLLVSTASGVVGTDLSELIGIVLLGLFEAALAEQASIPPEERQHYLVLIDEFQVYRGANYQMMLAELRKYGGSFGLATQSLSYLDRLDRTLRSTVLANIDHLFAFHMAGEDARLLHELDGIAEDDITNLDDFQCYVKLSLGGRRLPVFSLNLDAPPSSDAEVATTIRLCSQQRDARPVGAVDRLIQQSRMRQQLIPGTPRTASRGRRKEAHPMDQQPAQRADPSTGESVPVEGSARKRRKRGGSSRKQSTETVPPAYQHIMYDEEGAAAAMEHEEPEEEPGSDG